MQKNKLQKISPKGELSPTVLITGGAVRIGKEIALELAKNGYNIAIHYAKSKTSAENLQKEIQQKYNNIKVEIFAGDFQKNNIATKIFTDVWQKMGGINLLINNAALFEYDNPENTNTISINKHINVNLIIPVLLAQNFYIKAKKLSKTNQNFCIINILDQKLFAINPDYFSYTLAKSALQSATLMMAQQFAPQIRVCGIAPGLTLPSPIMDHSKFARAQKLSLTGNSGTPQSIAHTVLFLAQNRHITGEIIKVDGGQSLIGLARDVAFTV